MFRSLCVLMLLSGCATAYDRVMMVKTLEEAKTALQGAAPTVINQHPPNAEAWYFGWQRCVLFIDGIHRWSKSVEQTGVKASEAATVDCSLEAFRINEAEALPNPVLGELNGATTLDEARAKARTPSEVEKPMNDVERWYFGMSRCALFVKGKLTSTHIDRNGLRATCAVE